MFCLLGTQGLDLLVGTQSLDLPRLNVVQPLHVLFWRNAYRHVSQPPNDFVMQGLDLLGGRPRLAAQELETWLGITHHNSGKLLRGARNPARYNTS